jgi:nitrite reductase (cytochrome c-552)
VRSPLLNLNRACQSCHKSSEEELADKVRTIQSRTDELRDRAAQAMIDMLDAIRDAETVGVPEGALQPVLRLQRRAMWRLDFISSENSHGFHADQEAMRVLAESIDFSRQAQVMAVHQMASARLAAVGAKVEGGDGATNDGQGSPDPGSTPAANPN